MNVYTLLVQENAKSPAIENLLVFEEESVALAAAFAFIEESLADVKASALFDQGRLYNFGAIDRAIKRVNEGDQSSLRTVYDMWRDISVFGEGAYVMVWQREVITVQRAEEMVNA